VPNTFYRDTPEYQAAATARREREWFDAAPALLVPEVIQPPGTLRRLGDAAFCVLVGLVTTFSIAKAVVIVADLAQAFAS